MSTEKTTSIEYRVSEDSEREIEVLVNGTQAGYIEVSEDCIEMIEIEEPFRGLGLYKELIRHALILTDLDSLRSKQRNLYSNPAWEKWIGKELDLEDECYVSLDDEDLCFIAESDC